MKNRLRIFVGLSVVLLLALIKFCSVSHLLNKKLDNLKEQTYSDSMRFERLINDKGEEVNKLNQFIVSKNSEVAKLIERNEYLSKVTQEIKVKTVTTIREVEIPVHVIDSIECRMKFSYNDTWYGINGKVDRHKLTLDSVYFVSEPVIHIGYDEKKWYQFFKKDVPSITYKDKNPYSHVVKMSNITIEQPNDHFYLGMQVGYGVNKVGLSPYVGLGLGYKIISF